MYNVQSKWKNCCAQWTLNEYVTFPIYCCYVCWVRVRVRVTATTQTTEQYMPSYLSTALDKHSFLWLTPQIINYIHHCSDCNAFFFFHLCFFLVWCEMRNRSNVRLWWEKKSSFLFFFLSPTSCHNYTLLWLVMHFSNEH